MDTTPPEFLQAAILLILSPRPGVRRRVVSLNKGEAVIDVWASLTVQEALAANPDAGDLIKETGGLRKIRWVAGGKGKGGGVPFDKPRPDGSRQLTLTPLPPPAANGACAMATVVHDGDALVDEVAAEGVTTYPTPLAEVMPDDESQRQDLSW